MDIRQFDMAAVSTQTMTVIRQSHDIVQVDMKRCGPYLSLEVPGLAEGRPSLLMGDRGIVCEPGKLCA